MKDTLSFAIGDTVKLVKPKSWADIFPTGKVGIITDASASSGYLEYAFNGNAWFEHKQFELVKPATKETIQAAIKFNQGEDEDL